MIGRFLRRLEHETAKRAGGAHLPPRALLLLTNPRSGSTWFFDALQSFPGVDFDRRARLFRSLCASGRRYPLDLTNGPDGVKDVEFDWWNWGKVPVFDVSSGTGHAPERLTRETWSVEKFHPEFFGFNAEDFLKSVSILENKGVRVAVVYHVREPRASFSSFLNYQERNPQWYKRTKGKRLADLLLGTYRSMFEIADRRPDLVVDYGDMIADLPGVLQRVHFRLWENPDASEKDFVERMTRAVAEATSRKKRVAVGTKFLGQKAGPVRGGADKHAGFFAEYDREVARAVEYYDRLTGAASK